MSFSICALFCLHLEFLQIQSPKTLKLEILDVQNNYDVINEDINFNNLSYNIVTEKVAINPHYQYAEEEKPMYALADNTAIYSRPEENKQEKITLIQKRDEIQTLGYNSYNNTYKILYNDEEYYVNANDFYYDKNLILDACSGTRYINTGAANFREYPAQEATSMDKITVNTPIELIGYSHSGYFKVKYNDKEGFVHGDYLSETEVNYVTPAQQAVADIARRNAGTFPCRSGYCAAWVSGVYRAAVGSAPSGNAIDYWIKWSHTGSTSSENIPVGAVVVGCGGGGEMGNLYGHVGIYIGDGMVADNIGSHRIISLERWISQQTGNCRGYSGFCGWVWPNDLMLGDGV